MPEPASLRSLEDILASIRKSLADETVDGLVELSAAAVDAARAEQAPRAARHLIADLPAAGEEPRSAADVVADDLLRDKLAVALVQEGDVDGVEADAEAQDDDATPNGADVGTAAGGSESAALAKLWVLRPGIDKAKAAEAVSQVAAFSMSPRDLLGDAKVMAAPLPSLPQAPAPAAGTSGPPRLDADSIALLQKLRASNAAAIENMARENEEAVDAADDVVPPIEEVPASVTPVPEIPVAEAPTGAILDEPTLIVSESAPVAARVLALESITEPVADARPLVSRPERSTPLFGGHADLRPQVTSGLDHLLPEQEAAPVQASLEPPEEASPPLAQPEVAPAAAFEEVVAPLEPDAVAHQAVEATVDAEPVTAPAMSVAAPADDGAQVPQAVLPAGNKALEDMIAAVLEPVLHRLIETSIGPALEALVRREVERAMKEQRAPD